MIPSFGFNRACQTSSNADHPKASMKRKGSFPPIFSTNNSDINTHPTHPKSTFSSIIYIYIYHYIIWPPPKKTFQTQKEASHIFKTTLQIYPPHSKVRPAFSLLYPPQIALYERSSAFRRPTGYCWSPVAVEPFDKRGTATNKETIDVELLRVKEDPKIHK